MVTRAVSAERWLTPLAVLIPIGATPLLALWAMSTAQSGVGPVLALLVLGVGFTAIVVAGRFTYGARISVVTTAITWIVAFLALPVWYGISINTSICGKNVAAGWVWLPPTVGSLVFLALGGWGLRTHRALWVVPLASLAGVLVLLALTALVPGTPGTCDT